MNEPSPQIKSEMETIEVNVFTANMCKKISVLLTETAQIDVIESKWCVAIALHQTYLSIQSSEKTRNYFIEQCRTFLKNKRAEDLEKALKSNT